MKGMVVVSRSASREVICWLARATVQQFAVGCAKSENRHNGLGGCVGESGDDDDNDRS